MNKCINSSGTDEGGCISAGFAKRFFSKTSVKSSSSSSKNANSTRDEILKLHTEIGKLKETLDHLHNVMDDKDASIGNLAREKEKLYSELKKIQRVNRNIHQQLEDERDFYQKEKEHFCQELINLKRYDRQDGQPNYKKNQIKEPEKKDESLEERLLEKDKVIYNLCVKYLRIKSSKASLKNKIHNITAQHQLTYDYTMYLLDANQRELDKVISEKTEDKTLTNKKYASLIKRNVRLQHENTQMKIRLIFLTKNHKKLNEKFPKIQTTHCMCPKKSKVNQVQNKLCKSDGKFQEWKPEATDYNLKRPLYTHSHEATNTNIPTYLNHRTVNKRYNPIELVYTKTKTQRPSTDPG